MAPRKRAAAPRKKTRPSKRTRPRKRLARWGVITALPGRPLAYTPALKANAKHRWENTPESAFSIATDLGMHHVSLKRLARREGWVRRNPPPKRDITPVMRLAAETDALVGTAQQTGAAAHSRESGNPAKVDMLHGPEPATLGPRFRGDERTENAPHDTSAIDRLEQAVLKELAVVERMRANLGPEPLRPFDAQVTARTLSSLTETLGKLRRLRLAAQPQPALIDDMPADIDAFRHALARRIEVFLANWTSRADGDPMATPDVAHRDPDLQECKQHSDTA